MMKIKGNKKVMLILACFITGAIIISNLIASFAFRSIMPWLLGPAESYSVWLWAWPWDAPFGKISRLVINGKNIRIPGNPKFERLKIDIHNIDLDPLSWSIGKIKKTKFTAKLNQDDINKYLVGKLGPITNHKLLLLPGKIAFEGIYNGPLKIMIPISLKGELEIKRKQVVILKLDHLKIIDTTIPPLLLKIVQPIINPVVDLRKGKIKFFIDRCEVKEQVILIEGEAFIKTGKKS
ncbi:MAG: LmeA family phospholipid-binding protein [Candidatus Eremiobacteraeota bacterium]|nr:LmeA family phospholipid-binding protein [Candidatus Eremiobacteraeota bacterium]